MSSSASTVRPSRARASGGVGLGLSIAAAIAGVHGRRATARAQPGRGTTFTVTLPAVPDLASADGGEESG